MKKISRRCLTVLGLFALTPALWAGPKIELLTFADLVTAKDVKPKWSWHSIGIDPDDNVYAVFGGPSGPAKDLADCILVEYQARTGRRRYLGLLSDAAKAAGTLRPGEHIEKGHSQILWQNGKMYLGTLGFHDAAIVGSPLMKLALSTHGAHLMSYDPKTDRIEDLGKDQPDGVFFPNRGFMTLGVLPERNLLVAYTVPHGDLLFYDTAAGKVRATVPGVPQEFGRHVSREIIATASGKVYYSYTPAGADHGPGHMYCYDLTTGKRSETPVDISPNYWNAQARTQDGKSIYLTNQPGEVFQFHPESGTVELIGNLVPEGERHPTTDAHNDYSTLKFLGMALSGDEKYLYSIPLRTRFDKRAQPAGASEQEDDEGTRKNRGMAPQGLYAFELASRRAQRVVPWPKEMPNGYITGSGIRDSKGNLYFAHHSGPATSYGIVKISFDPER